MEFGTSVYKAIEEILPYFEEHSPHNDLNFAMHLAREDSENVNVSYNGLWIHLAIIREGIAVRELPEYRTHDYYYKLTDRGKKLKELMSWEKLWLWEYEQKIKSTQKEQMEFEKIKWEVDKMKVTYRLAVAGFALSLLALIPSSIWHLMYTKLQQIFSK